MSITAVQSQKAVSVYFTTKRILPFGFVEPSVLTYLSELGCLAEGRVEKFVLVAIQTKRAGPASGPEPSQSVLLREQRDRHSM